MRRKVITEHTQVLVIGGGPAGSTAATLLAQEGLEVTLLERDRFPRYHIGESILPSVLPVLELMGAREKIAAHGFRRKGGSYFEWGSEKWPLPFADLQGNATYSWQVIRSEFDELLLRHAQSQGVRVREGIGVREVHFDSDRAGAVTWSAGGPDGATGRLRFDWLVDASGRAGVLSRHFGNRQFHDIFRNIAVWGYWEGAAPIERGPEGAIAVLSVPGGWFWAIPLHDGTLSVGLVTAKDRFATERDRLGGIDAVYAEALATCPLLTEVLAGARMRPGLKVETDYSYVAERFAGPGYLLAGDAAAFLDPLLSTGVHLAMFSGMLAAATTASICRGEVDEDRALRFYHTTYRHAYERLMVLVSVFYDSYRGRQDHFFTAQRLTRPQRGHLRLHEAFLHIVTGIEDLDDATASERAYEMVSAQLRGEAGGSANPLANANSNPKFGAVPLAPETAIEGLYLATRPRLALRAVNAARV